MTIILVFLLKSLSHVVGVAPAVGRPAAAEEHPHDRGLAGGRAGHHLEVADHRRGRSGRRRSARRDARRRGEVQARRPERPLHRRSADRPGVARHRQADPQAQRKDPSDSEAILIADTDTPYRLLIEVLFTLGQTEFAKFHMMVLQSNKPGG